MAEARLAPPFQAVVEDVQRHQVQNNLALAIRLRMGDGSRLTITEPQATLTETAFAEFLQPGHSYMWPRVFAEFEQGLHKPTNKELQTQLR